MRSLHIGFGGAFERLAVNKGPLISQPFLMVAWAGYLLATLWLIACATRGGKRTTMVACSD